MTFAGAGVITGGAIIAAGTRVAWAQAMVRPSSVAVPGLPRIVLAGGRLTFDASAVGAGYLFGLGLLLALVPLGWLVTGPGGRAALALVAIAVAGVTVWQTVDARSHVVDRARAAALRELPLSGTGLGLQVSSRPGIPVTASGAAIAILSALAGLSVGGKAPRLGFPERPAGPERPSGPEGPPGSSNGSRA